MSMRMVFVLVAAVIVGAVIDAGNGVAKRAEAAELRGAQQTAPSQAMAAPEAKEADVASPDAIIAAVYDVISGPAGKKRDWDRFRSLFAPGARLIPTGTASDGSVAVHVLTAEDYVSRASTRFETTGFYEKEVARRTERWANILQAFSTYESRHDSKDATPFARGINSFQLFFDGKRWWIVTIFWQAETPQTPLTKDFLPASN